MSTEFTSDITLGEKYQDIQTGVIGIATSVHFYQFACERVTIEVLNKDGELRDYTFDAPRLKNVETGKVALVSKTGGPGDGLAGPGQRSIPSR